MLKKDANMKKISMLIAFMLLTIMISGCTKTWNGVKYDTGKAWDSSKKAVHEATA